MIHTVLEELGFEYVHTGHPSSVPFWRCRATGTTIEGPKATIVLSQAEALQAIHEHGRVTGLKQQYHKVQVALKATAETFQ